MNEQIIPAITPTPKQWEVLDRLHDPYVKVHPWDDRLHVYEVIDDTDIAHYTIAENGKTIVERLAAGFGSGWTQNTLDS